MSQAVKKRSGSFSKSAASEKKCLVPDCTNKSFSRGCCQRCLQSFRRQVKAGITTFPKLIRAGLVLKAHEVKHGLARQVVKRIVK